MDPKCIQAVNAAAGKRLSPAKLNAIEDAIDGKMRELASIARADARKNGGSNAWLSMSHEQQMIEAATKAMEDIQAQAALKEARATMQILRTAETEARIGQQSQLSKLTRSQAWIRDMELSQIYIDRLRNESIGQLTDMLDAVQVKDGQGFWRKVGMSIFDLDNPAMTRDIVREIFGGADGKTGNAIAKAGAKAWLDTIEGLRVRFNAAGGDIGDVGYGYVAQHHDRLKIAKTAPETWADATLPLLNRERYVEPDGTLTPTDKLREMLVAAHETLATGGDNKREVGSFSGTGARANNGSQSRVLHFKDGDAWMAYMDQYGEGSLYDAMMGHIGAMTKDIGLVERYGPNPEQQARVQLDLATRADKDGTIRDRRKFGTTPQARWDILSGKTSAPFEPRIAEAGDFLRSWQVAAKLGGAVVSSLTDIGSIAQTLHFNRLPYFDYLANVKGQMNKEVRAELASHGIIGEALADGLNRFTGDHLTHSIAGRVASATMKVSFMNAWSDSLRRAFSMTQMHAFSKKAGKSWESLDQWDRYLMERKGITAADWEVISSAEVADVAGRPMLTPSAIKATGKEGADQIATKWGAFVNDEAQFAVINPDQATRAIVTGGGAQRGTITGEAWRTFAQFKSFPLAMISRHWDRVFQTPQGLEGAPMGFGAKTEAGARANRIAMFAAMNVSLMLLGAMVLQTKALLSGKDAMVMDPEEDSGRKFWAKAMGQGGGLSFVADALLADPADGNTRTWENKLGLLGPVPGTIGGAIDVGPENLRQFLQGKETNIGPETLRWINSNLPGVNLWYVRQMWQRNVIDQAQEAMNPGYLSRMQQRARKDWDTSWYWAPGEQLPERAPDLSTVTGD